MGNFWHFLRMSDRLAVVARQREVSITRERAMVRLHANRSTRGPTGCPMARALTNCVHCCHQELDPKRGRRRNLIPFVDHS